MRYAKEQHADKNPGEELKEEDMGEVKAIYVDTGEAIWSEPTNKTAQNNPVKII